MRRASIQRRSLALAALVLAAGALVAGCGVPVAASPDVLSAKSVPDGLLSPPTRPFRQQTTPKGDFDIFLIDTSTTKLVAVARPAVGGLGVQQALNDLLVGPTGSDQFEGLVSYLAPGVPLRATGPNAQGVVTINLGQNFGPNLQPQAVAQMVWTVFQVRGVKGVLFVENGAVVRPPTESDVPVHRPLTTADFIGYFQ